MEVSDRRIIVFDKLLDDGFSGMTPLRRVGALSSLAEHEYKMGDRHVALRYIEELIRLLRGHSSVDENNFPNLLLRAGELNIYVGKRKRGLRLLTEAIDCITKLYGVGHERVRIAKEQVKQLSQHTKTPYQAKQQR